MGLITGRDLHVDGFINRMQIAIRTDGFIVRAA